LIETPLNALQLACLLGWTELNRVDIAEMESVVWLGAGAVNAHRNHLKITRCQSNDARLHLHSPERQLHVVNFPRTWSLMSLNSIRLVGSERQKNASGHRTRNRCSSIFVPKIALSGDNALNGPRQTPETDHQSTSSTLAGDLTTDS
jgi:hypothetical protein